MPLAAFYDNIDPLDIEKVVRKMVQEIEVKQMKRMGELKVIDEKTRTFIKKYQEGYLYGVVYISDNYVEFGWFEESPNNIFVVLKKPGFRGIEIPNIVPGMSREALSGITWSNKIGYYILAKDYSPEELLQHKLIRGQGNFPYQFPRRYEAAESFDLFKNTQTVLEDIKYPLSNYLDYTFGLEFETSMGYIPQEKCFRDGLIPLRDGSISGIEYSTVILKGNKGLNLLKQQLNTLKEYTKFNKECALHIHMGGFPIDPACIFALYSLWYVLERDLENSQFIPALSFHTAQYKANGKDYCNKLNGRARCFEKLYEGITGVKYFGSLVQPHPNDIEKKAKWNIKTRYYGLNLVNMVCYKSPKTVEFRFLRPSFNYRKITLWLYIFNAVLKYAEKLASEWKAQGHCDTMDMLPWVTNERYNGIGGILDNIYDEDTVKYLTEELRLLRLAVKAQNANGDDYGRDIEFEEELFV